MADFKPRPLVSYNAQGEAAYGDGLDEAACPYTAGTLAACDWILGMRETALSDWSMISSDDPMSDDELDSRRGDVSAARSARRDLIYAVRDVLPTLPNIAQAIAMPVGTWRLNCHAVSTAIVNSGILADAEKAYGPAHARYGLYSGAIAQESLFAGRSMARHGWIEFQSGLVLDPTRFVFEARDPCLWVGSIEDYDLGANRMRKMSNKSSPAYDADAKQVQWTTSDAAVTTAVSLLFRDGGRLSRDLCLSFEQAVWLANLPPEILGEHTPEIYGALDAVGFGAFIPLDNKQAAQVSSFG